ncbi:hypothetical protein IV203_014452 [Nitzschia inconspicua]|uniref:Uncharacterized protein n=1 Tax=Nitzschia inconspicua TaxID=303405 RepID=A0A9K3PS64_9STRA|nr:hypothetical protein IV203_014452 [Nitzschia inconspicua]
MTFPWRFPQQQQRRRRQQQRRLAVLLAFISFVMVVIWGDYGLLYGIRPSLLQQQQHQQQRLMMLSSTNETTPLFLGHTNATTTIIGTTTSTPQLPYNNRTINRSNENNIALQVDRLKLLLNDSSSNNTGHDNATTTTILLSRDESSSSSPPSLSTNIGRNISGSNSSHTDRGDDDDDDDDDAVVTLEVSLSGEFGNHLQKLARAVCIAKLARDGYNVTMRLLLKQQLDGRRMYRKNRRRNNNNSNNNNNHDDDQQRFIVKGKAVSTQHHLQRCFDVWKPYDFGLGNRLLEGPSSHRQDYFVSPANVSMDGTNLDDIRNNLERLSLHVQSSSSFNQSSLNGTDDGMLGLPSTLVTTTTLQEEFLVDRYYDYIRQSFVFDDEACCQDRPDPDESVFHYRGFATEMPKVFRTKGFQELGPYDIAHQLFGHLQAGDKVAIVGRFVYQEMNKPKTTDTAITTNTTNTTNTSSSSTTTATTTHQIVEALESRGLIVRTITGGDAMQDFCFLKSAQRELVGMIRSTYVKWAFLLGNATMTKFYVVDSPLMRKAHGDNWDRLAYNWTHPALRERYKVEVYQSNEEGII